MSAVLAFLWSNPIARKVLAALLGAAVLAVAYLYLAHLRSEITALTTQRDQARQAAAAVTEDRDRILANARDNAAAVTQEHQRETAQQQKVKTIVEKVYRDREPTPEACRAVLAPIDDALDGVLDLQAGSRQ